MKNLINTINIKPLYEGILADIESTLSTSDDRVEDEMMNAAGSKLRQYFNIKDFIHKPFITDNNGLSKTLTVLSGANGSWVRGDYSNNTLSDFIDNVDTVKCIRGVSIHTDNLSDKSFCKNIIGDSISIGYAQPGKHTITISNVNMYAQSVNDNRFDKSDLSSLTGNKIPTITIYGGSPVLNNCYLSISKSRTSGVGAHSMIEFHDIPTFNNVSSDNIQFLRITNGSSIVFSNVKSSVNIWNDKRWNNLFEFGYTLKYVHSHTFTENDAKEVKIKNIKDIKKIVSSKDFYSRTYNEFPYRLKPNAKLSDFIDISKFKNLHKINFSDNKILITCENTRYVNTYLYKSTFTDTLKTCWDPRRFNLSDADKQIPITADGWRITIIRL